MENGRKMRKGLEENEYRWKLDIEIRIRRKNQGEKRIVMELLRWRYANKWKGQEVSKNGWKNRVTHKWRKELGETAKCNRIKEQGAGWGKQKENMCKKKEVINSTCKLEKMAVRRYIAFTLTWEFSFSLYTHASLVTIYMI